MPVVEARAESVAPIEHGPERIARAVFVAPTNIGEFTRRLSFALHAGIPLDSLPFADVHLIQKSRQSKPSAGMVMAPGGTADPEESDIQAVLREGAEETMSLALHEKKTRAKWETEEAKAIEFGIPGYEKRRSLTIRVLPVSGFALNMPREKTSGPESEDKIKEMPTFTPYEFRKLVTEGSVSKGDRLFPAAGHFTTAEVNDPIEMTTAQRAVQREVLESVMTEVDEFDVELKAKTLRAINRIRLLKLQEPVSSFAECEIDEITTGFVAAQMRMALADATATEDPSKPNPKSSLLRAIPYLTSELKTESVGDLFLSLPNHETIYAAKQMEQGFNAGVRVVLESIPDAVFPNKTELLERLLEGDTSVDILREAWPIFTDLSDVQRSTILKRANQSVIMELSEAYGVPKEDMDESIRAADQFHKFLVTDLKSQDESTEKFFKEFSPLNDINNAQLFTIMTYAIGLHPNVPEQEKLLGELPRILRFEALRHLALVSVGVEVAEKRRKADGSLFEAAMDSFFESPHKAVLDLGDGKIQNVYDRRTKNEIEGRKLHIRIDERQKKETVSGVRKRLQDPHVNDILGISIIVTDENFNGEGDPVEERVRVASALRDQLIEHARERIRDDEGWSISIVDPRTKPIESVLSLAAQKKALEESGATPKEVADWLKVKAAEIKGKRTGSVGDAMIRDKFILQYDGPYGEVQLIEVNIYPFETTESKKAPEEQAEDVPDMDGTAWLYIGGRWGYTEWAKDNAKGDYFKNRIVKRNMDKGPMEPTLSEALFYPPLYDVITERMTGQQLQTRKSRVAAQQEPVVVTTTQA